MNPQNPTIYKILAESELGSAGHTSGIVPVKATQNFFMNTEGLDSNQTKEIFVDFNYKDTNETFLVNVNYFKSTTHDHLHLTGNLLPAYKKAGAEKGDLLLFQKINGQDDFFKSTLIKKDSDDWEKIKDKLNGKAGGILENYNITENSLEEYDSPSELDSFINESNFPSEVRQEKIIQSERYIVKRSKAKGDFVLKKEKYTCEVDSDHKSFITRNNLPYMEKHHLIPLEYYDEFERNLDDISNIVCICPNCHRQIHYGKKEEVIKILENLYNKHSEALTKSNLIIDLNDLKQKYGV